LSITRKGPKPFFRSLVEKIGRDIYDSKLKIPASEQIGRRIDAMMKK